MIADEGEGGGGGQQKTIADEGGWDQKLVQIFEFMSAEYV